MAEYNYSKDYKNLIAQQELLEKSFNEKFEGDPREDEMLEWLEGYKKTHEDILEMADQEIGDIEWEKDDEIDDLTREIRNLEGKVDELEREIFEVNTLEDKMKVELFEIAMKKYTLVQLEEKLGNKFQLI